MDELVSALRLDACPDCGAPDRTAVHSGLSDRWFAVPGVWGFARCSACGLVYLDPRPQESDASRLYVEYYTHEPPWGPDQARVDTNRQPPGPLGWLHQQGQRVLDRARHQIETMGLAGRPPGRLLDIGCGDGRLLARMQALGWEVAGVEPDPAGAAAARRLVGDVIWSGSLASGPFAADAFDAVTMSHVIEHVERPVDLLFEAHGLLRRGGVVVIATPNIEGLGYRWFRSAWRDLDPPRHLRLYSRATLEAVVGRAGLTVLRTETTAARAEVIARGSLEIKQAGRQGTVRLGTGSGAFALAFTLFEAALVGVRPLLGEEILLTATR